MKNIYRLANAQNARHPDIPAIPSPAAKYKRVLDARQSTSDKEHNDMTEIPITLAELVAEGFGPTVGVDRRGDRDRHGAVGRASPDGDSRRTSCVGLIHQTNGPCCSGLMHQTTGS